MYVFYTPNRQVFPLHPAQRRKRAGKKVLSKIDLYQNSSLTCIAGAVL